MTFSQDAVGGGGGGAAIIYGSEHDARLNSGSKFKNRSFCPSGDSVYIDPAGPDRVPAPDR